MRDEWCHHLKWDSQGRTHRGGDIGAEIEGGAGASSTESSKEHSYRGDRRCKVPEAGTYWLFPGIWRSWVWQEQSEQNRVAGPTSQPSAPWRQHLGFHLSFQWLAWDLTLQESPHKYSLCKYIHKWITECYELKHAPSPNSICWSPNWLYLRIKPNLEYSHLIS